MTVHVGGEPEHADTSIADANQEELAAPEEPTSPDDTRPPPRWWREGASGPGIGGRDAIGPFP